MRAKGAGDLLHRLDPDAHRLATPEVEKLAGPGRGVVLPRLLEVFLEQIGADSLQVIAEQVAKPNLLPVGQILRALDSSSTVGPGFRRQVIDSL